MYYAYEYFSDNVEELWELVTPTSKLRVTYRTLKKIAGKLNVVIRISGDGESSYLVKEGGRVYSLKAREYFY